MDSLSKNKQTNKPTDKEKNKTKEQNEMKKTTNKMQPNEEAEN